jgi:3-hydroxybutyryl-CoA dehydrogenase
MINEAINCVHEGLASADDIDTMMKLGATHPMGPLSLADLIGLTGCLRSSFGDTPSDARARPPELIQTTLRLSLERLGLGSHLKIVARES